ncbi:GNAT family N-acetyltransferase [Marinicella meishanensis]|uniref:GNAT family N-acetyltransferase n=1 Tax=Marinicella meishanensis TaxID=2873263 RepID=UPI001CBF5BBF|nr:GNAT family N-acetyltransferase [Marinicella sp. NBU2979]
MAGLIRPAQPAQAPVLSDLAQRSKAHWGYPADFMQAVVAELTYSPESIRRHPTQVLMDGEQVLGFYQLQATSAEAVELEALFVDPQHLRQGLGGKLFRHAVLWAQSQGFQEMTIQSDPHAAAFYAIQGCTQVGEMASLSIPGRQLPLFRLSL